MLIRGLCAAGFFAVAVSSAGWATGIQNDSDCLIDNMDSQACVAESGELIVVSAGVASGLPSFSALGSRDGSGNVPVPFSVMMLGTIIVGGIMFARRRSI